MVASRNSCKGESKLNKPMKLVIIIIIYALRFVSNSLPVLILTYSCGSFVELDHCSEPLSSFF